MDKEAWHAVIHGVAKSQTRLRDWSDLIWSEVKQWRQKFEDSKKLQGQLIFPPLLHLFSTKNNVIHLDITQTGFWSSVGEIFFPNAQVHLNLYLKGWGPRVICTSRLSELVIPDKPIVIHLLLGFPGGAAVKDPAANAGNTEDASIPGWGRSPGGGNGNPLQYYCLENPHRQRSIHGVTKSWTRLSTSRITWLHSWSPYWSHINLSLHSWRTNPGEISRCSKDVWDLTALSAQSCYEPKKLGYCLTERSGILSFQILMWQKW